MSLITRHIAQHAALSAVAAALAAEEAAPIAADPIEEAPQPAPLAVFTNPSLIARRMAEAQAMVAAGSVADPYALTAPAPMENDEYRDLLEQLGEDLMRLSQIESTEAKIEAKRQMVDNYRDWICGVLRAGEDGAATQDDIIAITFIWFLDIQDWEMAAQIGAHILTHKIKLERHKRNPACILAEDIAEASLKDIAAVDHGTLIAIDEMTAPHDMPDQVRAKLKKAIGRNLADQATKFDPEASEGPAGGKAALIEAALEQLRRALALNEQSGVKKDIETLERELKKITSTN
jgi:hypothetical protein